MARGAWRNARSQSGANRQVDSTAGATEQPKDRFSRGENSAQILSVPFGVDWRYINAALYPPLTEAGCDPGKCCANSWRRGTRQLTTSPGVLAVASLQSGAYSGPSGEDAVMEKHDWGRQRNGNLWCRKIVSPDRGAVLSPVPADQSGSTA